MMENKVIKQELIEWRHLEWFQPKDIKKYDNDIVRKLKKSLNNKSNGETYVSLNNVLISLIKFVLSKDQRVKLNKT